MSINVHVLKAFTDNYIFIIEDGKDALAIDAGDAKPVIDFLQKKSLNLLGILCTHHHHDHIGGNAELQQAYGAKIYALDKEKRIKKDVALHEQERFQLLGLQFEVIYVPGHTRHHIAFFVSEENWLFCGDTLFSLGCGRLFEGSHQQMFLSLQKLKALPVETKVFCAHEYTLANLEFAKHVLSSQNWQMVESEVRERLQRNNASIPSTLRFELENNVFLQAKNVEDFKNLRERKDQF